MSIDHSQPSQHGKSEEPISHGDFGYLPLDAEAAFLPTTPDATPVKPADIAKPALQNITLLNAPERNTETMDNGLVAETDDYSDDLDAFPVRGSLKDRLADTPKSKKIVLGAAAFLLAGVGVADKVGAFTGHDHTATDPKIEALLNPGYQTYQGSEILPATGKIDPSNPDSAAVILSQLINNKVYAEKHGGPDPADQTDLQAGLTATVVMNNNQFVDSAIITEVTQLANGGESTQAMNAQVVPDSISDVQAYNDNSGSFTATVIYNNFPVAGSTAMQTKTVTGRYTVVKKTPPQQQTAIWGISDFAVTHVNYSGGDTTGN